LLPHNARHARHVQALRDAAPDLELLAPVPLNVVCFRYAPAGVPDHQLDDLNREILTRVQESGLAVPSHTVLQGRFAIRVSITNHRTRRDDLDLLVQAVHDHGQSLTDTHHHAQETRSTC
jgi:glutamate/tyrosine decarboxylase-like PLP-dependent enzyme